MKYIITENRIIEVMSDFLKKNYPTLAIKDPFRPVRHSSHGNSGYGSGLDDYIKITTYYLDEDETPWFKHFDDRDIYEDSKWEVNEELETMYYMFGEENFQLFIKEYFGFDLSKKGNKKYDWLFR
jgi:hypothetical protein